MPMHKGLRYLVGNVSTEVVVGAGLKRIDASARSEVEMFAIGRVVANKQRCAPLAAEISVLMLCCPLLSGTFAFRRWNGYNAPLFGCSNTLPLDLEPDISNAL